MGSEPDVDSRLRGNDGVADLLTGAGGYLEIRGVMVMLGVRELPTGRWSG